MADPPVSLLEDSRFFRWACEHGSRLTLSCERTLIQEGVQTPDLFLLLEGRGQVRTSRTAPAGAGRPGSGPDGADLEAVDLAEIGPGQFVGEMSLLEQRLPVATVVALPGSRWLQVSYAALQAAMAVDPQLAIDVYQVFATKLALQLSRQNAFIHRWPGHDVEPLRKVLLLFGEWNDRDVAWLAEAGHRLEVGAGVTFIAEGQPVDQLYVLLDGEADVLIAQGKSGVLVGSSRRGEVLGEMSFLGGGEEATASVRARQPLQLLAIPKRTVRQQLRADLHFAQRFYRSLAVLLSHRCRDQLLARGMAAQAAALEELDLAMLSSLSAAGRRFEWLCREMAQA